MRRHLEVRAVAGRKPAFAPRYKPMAQDRLRRLDLQIVGREVTNSGQVEPIADSDLFWSPIDQSKSPQFLYNAVGMDARDSAGISDIDLSPWNGKADVAREIHCLQTDGEFADDMGHPCNGLAPSQIGDPFPKNRDFDKRRGKMPE
ncbi:MAG: hypothetical protein JWP51_4490 [Bradyrhizobium sp.]|jgi:hypothetical protein|nr:hypothetical protein [Bradyrhizobium sp.]